MNNKIINENYFGWYNANENLRMRYPSEIVIGFLVNNLEKKSRVLDLGCGSGRHVILSAELGHEAFGVDISDSGFIYCKKQAKAKGLTVYLKKSQMDETGFRDNCFDAVVCYSAISANNLEDQSSIINEVKRILKPNGIFLVNFYGEKDGVSLKCKKEGKRITERTYIIPGNLFHESATDKVPDYLFHISTKDEIKNLLSSFREIRQFEIHLLYGNASFKKDPKPSHLIYAITKN